MPDDQLIPTFTLHKRGPTDNREYFLEFWDDQKWIEIDLTDLPTTVSDSERGTERGIDTEEGT